MEGVLHALASSEHADTPFLVVLVLPVWDDSPWTSNAIRGHNNMSTLIRIPAGHMRFVSANKQAGDASMELKQAKWPVELVRIANDMGREAYLSTNRIQTILASAIQATCRLNPEETVFFPTPRYPRHPPSLRSTACPSRSLPHSPAISTPLKQTGPLTLPQGKGIDLPTRENTT